jgi:hypothetical protein
MAGQNKITTRARGARASSGIMASASGVQPTSRYSFNAQRTHSIFSGPLTLNTRLQSGRKSLTAEPNSAVESRHVGTQTGIHAVAPSPNYPMPSPMMLGQPATGGTAQSSFGIPTVRGALTPVPMPMIPIMNRKALAAGRAITGRASAKSTG